MKTVLMSLIALLLSVTPCSGKDIITWMVLDWPPWMMLDGEDRGTGRFNYILDMAQTRLAGYDHVTERMNWARFWHEVEENKNLCYIFGLKSGKREKIVYYSAPHTLVLPNAVIMRTETARRLGNPASYSVKDLLREPGIRGYAEKNRSFTQKVDALMRRWEADSNLTRVAESPESLIKMVIAGRIGYTLEYPIVAAYYQKKFNAPGELVSIPISEMPPFSYVYMSCTRNEWGKGVIEQWNAVLREIKPTQAYRKITEIGHTDERELEVIRRHYDAFIGEDR